MGKEKSRRSEADSEEEIPELRPKPWHIKEEETENTPEAEEKRLIVGVDPGLSGAVAIIDPTTENLVALFDMPVLKKPSKARKSGYIRKVHGSKLAEDIAPYAPRCALAAVENVASRPGQGVASTYRFGHDTGLITGILHGQQIPVRLIAPNIWKPALGLSQHKIESLRLAQDLFPDYEDFFMRQKDDGRAEACLIGWFLMKQLKRG